MVQEVVRADYTDTTNTIMVSLTERIFFKMITQIIIQSIRYYLISK